MMICLLLFLPVFPVDVLADVQLDGPTFVKFEHDDFSNAVDISLNELITVDIFKADGEGNLEFDLVENYFRIVLPEDGYISGEFYEGDLVETDVIPIDHDLMVYTQQEEEIVELDNWELGLAAGTYYLKGAFVYNVPGHFKINYVAADDWEKEPNSDFARATILPRNVPINAWMASYDSEFFTFTMPESGIVTIGLDYPEASGDPEKTWSVDLFDAEENMIAGDSESEINIKNIGLGAGTYYISVELFDDETPDHHYQLFWDYTPSDTCETERNDSYETADQIPLNQAFFIQQTTIMTVHGNHTNDPDYFTFSLDAPGTVSLSLTPEEEGKYDFDIQDMDQNSIQGFELTCGPGETATTRKLGLPAGDYYLLQSVPSNTPFRVTVNYTATDDWEKECNDTPELATSIPPGTWMMGWHEDKDDHYIFTLTEPGYINVDLSYAFHEDELNQDRVFVLNLTDAEGEDMAVRSGSCRESSDTNTGLSIRKIGLDPGTYYLKIWSNWVEETADNYYQLKVDFTPADDYETEYNNDFGSADPIILDKDYFAQTMVMNDKDYFKFELPEDGKISIETDAEGPCVIAFEIRNNREEQISDWSQGSEEESVKATSDEIELRKGSYYLITNGGESVPYTFRVKYEKGSSEHVHILQGYGAHGATCGAEGNLAYWYCTICGKYYSNDTGSNEIGENSWVIPATGEHSYGDWEVIKDPTSSEEGSKERMCRVCGNRETEVIDKLPQGDTDDEKDKPPARIPISSAVVTVEAQTYTGEALTPTPTVTLGGKTLRNKTDYTVTYKNNQNVGTAKVIITGTGSYQGVKEATFTINKAANPLEVKVTGKTTFKRASLKKAKKITIKAGIGQGKVTYSLSKNAKKAKIKVSKKGKVTLPKKCKKGTYKIIIKAAGNNNYKAGMKTIVIKVN